jgi:poly(3-hydroxybutyrate) depolymerase
MKRLPTCALLLLATSLHAQDASYGETHRLKVDITGENRKVGFFVPKNIGRSEALPLLVALPDGGNARGKAFRETGQFEQMAYEKRFAVVSVDINSCSQEGWHPSDQVTMERDVEAVLAAIAEAKKKAAELGFTLDTSATAIRGHSGACYLAIWAGLRNPDVFLVVSINGVPKFFPEFLKFESEKDPNQLIQVYSGERDVPRVKRETEKTVEALKKAGYRSIEVDVVKGMAHEPKPEVFVDWYVDKLKKTAKARREALKIAEDAAELRELLKAGRSGVYRKIAKLAEKEKKAGFGKAATALYDEVLAESAAELKKAEDLAADNKLFEALDRLKEIEDKYKGLPASKTAKQMRKDIAKSDEFAAAELLEKAKKHLEAGRKEKGDAILVQLIEKYPESIAAERAKALLER